VPPSEAVRAAPAERDSDPRERARRKTTFCGSFKEAATSGQGASRADVNAEARIQAAIVEWARVVAPDILIFSIPNGGLRSKAEAARMKWTGVVAGVPDLCVIAPSGRAFFIEVKTPGGRLSPEQHAIFDHLVTLGTPAAIVRSIDDARLAFAEWSIPTREAHPNQQ
jgi:VRR-NUC domain